MNYTIYQNVPICPDCKALMLKRHQGDKSYYHCFDCMKIVQVIDHGKMENELICTDGRKDEEGI
jgi:tRNA(Ile2) C34 agmatinyltransferase TiaS